MARKLEIDDIQAAHYRRMAAEDALTQFARVMDSLRDAKAPAALHYARRFKKSLHGAVNHADRRYRAAQRKAAGIPSWRDAKPQT